MKKYIFIIIIIILIVALGVGSMLFWSRRSKQSIENNTSNNNIVNDISNNNMTNLDYVDVNTTVGEVINDQDFEGFGNLIFPVDLNIDPNTTLEDVGSYYMWYNYINPNKTVEIVTIR